VEQIVKSHPHSVIELLISENERVPFPNIPVSFVNVDFLVEITASKSQQGIAAVIKIPTDIEQQTIPEKSDKILLLEDVQDPGNVGVLIRTAAAFDFSGVIMSTGCADPFSPKTVQSSAGSILSCWLRRHRDYLDIVSRLKVEGWYVSALDLEGISVENRSKADCKKIICLGNEARGLTESLLALADERLFIDMNRKKVESLNVGVAGSIFMQQIYQQ